MESSPLHPGKEVWLIYHFRRLDLFKVMPQANILPLPVSGKLMTSQKVLTVSCSDSWRAVAGSWAGTQPAERPACVLLAPGRLLLKCIGFDFLG